MKRKITWSRSCWALTVSAALAGPAAARDTLTIGVAQFPASMHPYIAAQAVKQYALGLSLRRLTTYDHAGQVVCLLCTEVPTLENGRVKREAHDGALDGLAVTLTLKPGLAWGDGVPMTSQDIAYTWKAARDPNAGFVNNHPWTRASAIDVVDDRTVVLHLDRTYTTFALWDEVLSAHVDQPVFDAAAASGDYVNRTPYNRQPTNPGLWNGPYVLSGYQSGSSLGFAANPHWTGHALGLSSVTIRTIDNTAALQANLLSGDVDMAPSGIGLFTEQAVPLQMQHADRFRFIFKPQLICEMIIAQTMNPILRDERVRKALLTAVDVKAIVDRLLAGHGEIARSFVGGLDRHYTPDVPTYRFDPARARALLDEAGWTSGTDGIRRDAAGTKLALDFTTTAGNRSRELTQQVMQSQWKAIGVEVAIRNQPPRAFFGQMLPHREFTGLVEYAATLEANLVPTVWFSTPKIPSAANGWSGQNYSGISDQQLDADLNAAQYELDPAKQQALWADAQRLFAERLYALPLFFREDADIVPTWLGGYEATGKEAYATYWAERWRS